MTGAAARWDERFLAEGIDRDPSLYLGTIAGLFPASGRALDVAGGTGRHAVWLAQRGFAVTMVDVSPVGLDLAAKRAALAGVEISLVATDLETEPPPPGPWDVILVFHYLDRDLLESLPQLLAVDGVLVFVAATVRNLDRHPRPPAEWCLAEGEAARLFPELTRLRHEEGWLDEGRHEARTVWRRR